MKRNLISILFALSLLSVFNLSAQEKPEINLGIKAGYLTGNDYELVYYQPAEEGILLSMLDWDVSAPVIQFTAETYIKNQWYINFTPTVAIPCSSGKMQDYDWLKNPKETHELSCYSIHNNKLNHYFDLNLDFGYRYNLNKKIALTPYINGNFNSIYFSSYDGYGQYPDDKIWTPEASKEYFDGLVISYEQNIYSAGLGLKAEWYLLPCLQFNFGMQYNLIISYNSYDFHNTRDTIFGDEFYYKPSYVFDFETIIAVHSHWNLLLKANGNFIPDTYGDTYCKSCKKWKDWDNSGWIKDSSNGGTTRLLVNITAGCSYSF